MNNFWVSPTNLPKILQEFCPKQKLVHIYARENVTVPSNTGIWEGGSQSNHVLVDLLTKKSQFYGDLLKAPWDPSRRDHSLALALHQCLVQYGTFRGKPGTTTIYAHPTQAFIWEPEPIPEDELTDLDWDILRVFVSYTASGQKREFERMQILPGVVSEAKKRLVRFGYLKTRGGVTPKGKNVFRLWD